MNIDKHCFLAIQKTQRTLAMGVHRLDPVELLDRPTWAQAAQYLTGRWFPRSKDLAISELIQQSYLYAQYWYPILQQRCPGTFRPNWYQGTLLSWFRRVVTYRTQQWYFTSNNIETGATSSAAFDHATRLPGVRNSEWNSNCFEFLEGLTATGGRKSTIAKYLLETLAFLDVDHAYDQQFNWTAKPPERSKLRASGHGVASYLRVGKTIYILADAHCMKRHETLDWVDLRECEASLLDYRICYKNDSIESWEGLTIYLDDSIVSDARASIKAIITESGNPHYLIKKLRQFLISFEAQHRYAPGAWRAFVDISRYARSQSKRYLKARLPKETDKSLPQIRTTNTLIIPGTNPFMTTQPIESWERIFSPYR